MNETNGKETKSRAERLRKVAWEQLAASMDTLGQKARAKGLTNAQLESLLSDDS